MASAAAQSQPAHADIERKLWQLREAAERFAREPVSKKLGWLYQIRDRTARAAEHWAKVTCDNVHIPFDAPVAGEAWINGPGATLRMLRLLSISLSEIQRHGLPRLNGKARSVGSSGKLAVSVFPGAFYDRGVLPGTRAEVHLQPGGSEGAEGGEVPRASFYQRKNPPGRVALVLGAGNLSSIPAMDVLHKLFIEGQVVILKMNPVNAYAGPILEDVMKPLIDQGYLAIVYGGADVGQALCEHPQVDEIHITGSDRTHDAIVWGQDKALRDERRQAGTPLLDKRITSELGNITPAMIVPGPYTDRQLAAMAENLAGMVTQNASFNCVALKMLVLPRGWDKGARLLDAIRRVFSSVPSRYAYYPGAEERYQVLTRDTRNVETFGARQGGHLPWTLVRGLDPDDASTLQFKMEPFCSILSVVEIPETDPLAFLSRATRFCNDSLWGTLNAMVFVPPSQLKDPALAAAVESSVEQLRYGVVAINTWSAVGYAIGSTPWGGHPSSTLADIQSGQGWAHNTLMLENVEKCVITGPLEPPFKPVWSPLHRTCHKLAQKLCAFEADPDLWSLSKLGIDALRG